MSASSYMGNFNKLVSDKYKTIPSPCHRPIVAHRRIITGLKCFDPKTRIYHVGCNDTNFMFDMYKKSIDPAWIKLRKKFIDPFVPVHAPVWRSEKYKMIIDEVEEMERKVTYVTNQSGFIFTMDSFNLWEVMPLEKFKSAAHEKIFNQGHALYTLSEERGGNQSEHLFQCIEVGYGFYPMMKKKGVLSIETTMMLLRLGALSAECLLKVKENYAEGNTYAERARKEREELEESKRKYVNKEDLVSVNDKTFMNNITYSNYCTIHLQYYNHFCVYCGGYSGRYIMGGPAANAKIEDPCPQGGDHFWYTDLETTAPMVRCRKCPATESINYPPVSSAEYKDWQGLDYCSESADNKHKFIIAKKPGESPRCEYCKLQFYGDDYVPFNITTKAEAGPVTIGSEGETKDEQKISKKQQTKRSRTSSVKEKTDSKSTVSASRKDVGQGGKGKK